MEDKRKNNGGHKSAGRKPKTDEAKVNSLFVNAVDLLATPRGQIFVAEHLFGKPKETVHNQHELIDFDIKNYLKFGNSK
jgi:hypothetical protein